MGDGNITMKCLNPGCCKPTTPYVCVRVSMSMKPHSFFLFFSKYISLYISLWSSQICPVNVRTRWSNVPDSACRPLVDDHCITTRRSSTLTNRFSVTSKPCTVVKFYLFVLSVFFKLLPLLPAAPLCPHTYIFPSLVFLTSTVNV